MYVYKFNEPKVFDMNLIINRGEEKKDFKVEKFIIQSSKAEK